MQPSISPEVKELIQIAHYRPAVSIVVPFSPKIALRAELKKDIKYAIDEAVRQIRNQYPDSLSVPVIEKLNNLSDELIIPSDKYGLVIYASPVYSKVYFLDVLPPARIVIDESFEIRDLLFSKKQMRRYLVFLLSSEKCRLLLHDGHHLLPVKMDSHASIDAYINDETERVSNFSDPVAYKTKQVEKFIRQMDKELTQQIKDNQYPVFLMGSRTILGMFMSRTHNRNSLKGMVEGNFEKSSLSEIESALKIPVHQWKCEEESSLLKQIDEAAGQQKLAVGIEEVWKEAYEKKGRLLIVEQDYKAAGEHVSGGKIVYKPTGSQNDFQTSTDVVDDVMEMVIKNGGDVAFVDDGVLQNYGHIALVKYFA